MPFLTTIYKKYHLKRSFQYCTPIVMFFVSFCDLSLQNVEDVLIFGSGPFPSLNRFVLPLFTANNGFYNSCR